MLTPSFAVNPLDSETETRLPQCKPVTFSWQGDYVAPVSIVGVIPGGMVLGGAPSAGNQICELMSRGPAMPASPVLCAAGTLTPVAYPVNVALGSEIVYVSWDARGVTGGTSYVMRVTSGDQNCLDGSTASTTPVPPWNPSPTGSQSTPTRTKGGGVVTMTAIQTVVPEGSTAITPGAIAGIVIGVIAAVIILQALVLWFCCRRQVDAFLANRKKRKDARRMSGGIDLYERHPGSDGLLHSGAAMRDNHHRASRGGYADDDLGTTISPFMGGTTDSDSSPRISTASGTTGTGWGPPPPGAAVLSDRGSDRHAPSSYTAYPPTAGHNRSSSGGTPQSSTSRLPMKMQLALANPDNRNVFDDGQPSPNIPVAGFRRHEDAGSVTQLAADEPEDLPPTYNPQWGAGPQR